MNSRVAVVRIAKDYKEALKQALVLTREKDNLDEIRNDVTIKIGIYDPRALNYPTLKITEALVESFKTAPHVFLAESNNHIGKALDRLSTWKTVFTKNVSPFSLSEDKEKKKARIINETIEISHILYKPNFRVGLHAFRGLRGPGETLYGSALKNLLGIVPDINKERFHHCLSSALIDLFSSIGGLDLSVLDATYTYYGKYEEGKPFKRKKTDLLVIGRDAIATDAVGFALIGKDPMKVSTLVQATRKGLGQADLDKIEILGEPLQKVKIRLPV